MNDGIKINSLKEMENLLVEDFNNLEKLTFLKVGSSNPPILSWYVDFDNDEENEEDVTKGYLAIDLLNENLQLPMRRKLHFLSFDKEYTSEDDEKAWKRYKACVDKDSTFFNKLSHILGKYDIHQVYIRENEYGSKDFTLVDLNTPTKRM
ncbi:MAG: hypothetical protein HDS11_02500 [Bacteroides sp.]|nr:hypothetical protein [Bacteroides sp.]